MFKEKKIVFLIAETPIHAGSGSEVGIVDLPIQRERYTDFPKIESSGLKGCLKEAFRTSNKEIELSNGQKVRISDEKNISILFGPESDETYAGALTLTDAKILLFPVKSLKGVFAWITCPLVLERLKKDLQTAGKDAQELYSLDFANLEETVPRQSDLTISNKIVLEEFTYEVKEDQSTTQLAEFLSKSIFPQEKEYEFWIQKLKSSLVVLPDDEFTQFVKTSTEVITRTRIDDITGTVASGALWTEEYLPQDTILYSIAMFSSPRVEKDEDKGVFKADSPSKEAEILTEFFVKGVPSIIQIGGNQTIGKGLTRLNLF